MTKEEFKKSSCYNCKYSGMLEKLGWVKCLKKDISHILPVYNCKEKIREGNSIKDEISTRM